MNLVFADSIPELSDKNLANQEQTSAILVQSLFL